ncbi:MAG TPA: RluA family pseudouridine synthase [Acidobacteriota bacterium]|nr:RluA family pseudouridine synthase [Acidobacteriota bacterium]
MLRNESDLITLTVSDEDAAQRLDRYLVAKLKGPTRSAIQNWIKAERVRVGGAAVKAGYQVRSGDRVEIAPPEPEPSRLVPEPIPLNLVYEDNDLVVVDKPAGVVVHPGAGVSRGTLANALLYHFNQLSQAGTVRPGVVHRLDKATSGLLVVAKNEHVHEELSRQFRRREVEKRYLALVYGRLEKKKGVIQVPIGRDAVVRTKISTRSRKPREAVTEYEVVKEFAYLSLLRITLHTGRTHQIRVHLQHLRHPVVGDSTYGGDPKRFLSIRAGSSLVKEINQLGRHFLHAEFLAFEHPTRHERVVFHSPLPGELAQFLARLE